MWFRTVTWTVTFMTVPWTLTRCAHVDSGHLVLVWCGCPCFIWMLCSCWRVFHRIPPWYFPITQENMACIDSQQTEKTFAIDVHENDAFSQCSYYAVPSDKLEINYQFSIIHLNARSLKNKFDEMQNLLAASGVDWSVMCVRNLAKGKPSFIFCSRRVQRLCLMQRG